MRITVQQVADSRIPQHLGLCQEDIPRLCAYLNEGVQRLVQKGGESGWWGGYDKIVFNVSQSDPYITLPLQYARMMQMDVCQSPIKIQNEWYEFLEAGIGLQSGCACGPLQAFERGTVSTAYDLTSTNQLLRVYITDQRDIGKRILFSGAKDENGNGIYTQDVQRPVIGLYLTLQTPFVDSDFIVTGFSAIAKDETYGDIVVKQVDATTGEESLLARLSPKVISPTYRRYYIHSLPRNCCRNPDDDTEVQVTALLKFDYQPVSQLSDFLLIGNIPALKEICSSIRHRESDDLNMHSLAAVEERSAVKLLNEELTHYMGTKRPAINFAPFGTAHLARKRIGMLT